ncbi:MAG: beta/gamma crystallin-related protein [Candidatus Poribacteria bacterium]|nr:beta/gamma crystallin-related protein [Candidatus Poribacteria bacterium]
MPIIRPRLVVELYDGKEFSGRKAVVVENVASLADIGIPARICSARIFEGPGFETSPNQKAVLYDIDNYRGRSVALAPGFYPNIQNYTGWLGYIRSIRFESKRETTGPVWGGIPVVIETFNWPNFGGRRQTIVRDIPDTTEIGQENTISSIKIYKGPNFPRRGCRITFYSEPNFAGLRMPIEMRSTEPYKEFPNLDDLPHSIGNDISSIDIACWSDRSKFTAETLKDEFQNGLGRGWRKVYDSGDNIHMRQGLLTLYAKKGQDMIFLGDPNARPSYRKERLAPHMYQNHHGNFAIETMLPLAADGMEHGGLYIRKYVNRSDDQGVRLEKTCRAHAFHGGAMFHRHEQQSAQLLGRADMRDAKQAYLRLERKGDAITALTSVDGKLWEQCGETVMGMTEPVRVGMTASAPGETPDTTTRFAYFKMERRKRYVRNYNRIMARRERRNNAQLARTLR